MQILQESQSLIRRKKRGVRNSSPAQTVGVNFPVSGGDTLPGYDLTLEENILIAAMRNGDINAAYELIESTSIENFADPRCRAFRMALEASLSESHILDLDLVHRRLSVIPPFDTDTARHFIMGLLDPSRHAFAYTIPAKVALLKEASAARHLLNIAQKAEAQIRSGVDPFTVAFELSKSSMDVTERSGSDLVQCIETAGQFIDKPIAPREEVITDIVSTQQLGMIYAPTGVGKSHLAMSQAVAVACGTPFLGYPTPKARRVIYLDFEMAETESQDRWISHGLTEEGKENLFLLSHAALLSNRVKPLYLNTHDGQGRFDNLLRRLRDDDKDPEIIYFDNLSCLTPGDENDNAEQEVFLSWLRDLRARGYTVILIHHAGKNGSQRGASRREDFLDWVIKLTPPEKPVDGCEFTLTFPKFRGRRPRPSTLECKLIEDTEGHLSWATNTRAQVHRSRRDEVLALIHGEGLKDTKEIAARMGVVNRQVQKYLATLRQMGFLEGWTVTRKGLSVMEGEPDF